ncbi:EAL domain-containing protein [Stenotrophomonas sp. NA06056]|uniref:EAL domain-containing protein n=1 Tax=Stenotrophomonas sp. NA06056 TaxID=2742129 RepID=UPI00158B1869|nr:EAL domain-containing protein [Stenotrophomonas sp. NA06056]QKW55401.1 EAL domain-containing protein [Stenotrophomonas sp. NA06056]
MINNYGALRAVWGESAAVAADRAIAHVVTHLGGEFRDLGDGHFLVWPAAQLEGSRARWLEQLEFQLGLQTCRCGDADFVLCVSMGAVLGSLEVALQKGRAAPMLHDLSRSLQPPVAGAHAISSFQNGMAAALHFVHMLREGKLVLQQEPVVSRADRHRGLFNECLLRWEVGGQLVSAGSAIGMFEKIGFVKVVDRLVIAEAINHLSRDLDARLSCNVSALSLVPDLGWLSIFDRLRSMPGVASRMTLEVTETAQVQNPEYALELLRGLSSLGCRIAIDDFGDGFVRMAFCRVLQPSVIKLSATSLRVAASGLTGQELYGHLAGLARGMAPHVVAEGVESEEDVALIARAGLTWMQGNLLHASRDERAARILRIDARVPAEYIDVFSAQPIGQCA